ncbi:NDR1/HIN1-like protein 13 [Nicotiana tabacum]|uniref:Late embryogenesis abundant protein LEA-2 subgroup domain-containing protein n=1 Tax=Nicotiana tabacum TaxID=4097 RepID=A0A1S4B3P0_TOBAC|nr:PREDICTED: uncharacterized protein LOC107804143 [Nicotiana tabacum]XP_016483457.1 PREDICTED: uncharacterized protein LOC107804143 [Nicotiana tabacum]
MSMRKPLQKPPGYRETGIPIQRPPQSPFYPEKNNSRKRSFCCCCCCYFFIILIFLILLFIAVGAILYLWFDPKLPIFHLKSLEFTKFNITDSPDGPKLSAQATVSVELKNPNKQLKIIYEKTNIELKDEDGVTLGNGNVPGFVQGTKNVTVVKFDINMNELLYSENVAKVRDGLKNKSLKVSADVGTGFGIGFSGWKSETIGVRVSCGGLSLKQMENGTSPKCQITVLNRIHLD